MNFLQSEKGWAEDYEDELQVLPRRAYSNGWLGSRWNAAEYSPPVGPVLKLPLIFSADAWHAAAWVRESKIVRYEIFVQKLSTFFWPYMTETTRIYMPVSTEEAWLFFAMLLTWLKWWWLADWLTVWLTHQTKRCHKFCVAHLSPSLLPKPPSGRDPGTIKTNNHQFGLLYLRRSRGTVPRVVWVKGNYSQLQCNRQSAVKFD